MDFSNVMFKRKFSENFYKDLKINMGSMTFTNDFINTKLGDLYPLIIKSKNAEEKVQDDKYIYSGEVSRLIGQFYPFINYDIEVESVNGKCGINFDFNGTNLKVFINVNDDKCTVEYHDNINSEVVNLPFDIFDGNHFIIDCRTNGIDIYINNGNGLKYISTFHSKLLDSYNMESIFNNSTASLYVCGAGALKSVNTYCDCGTQQADIRPIKYEDGTVIYQNGKVYFTLSLRMQESSSRQGIISWIPGTCEFSLCGNLFFDIGDGLWGSDIASSIKFNRLDNKWYLWVCSFTHGHILGYSCFYADPRFSNNVIDLTLLKKAENNDDTTEFIGKEGDEDPDFVYNPQDKKWYMAICRLESGNYLYHFYQSDNPISGYKFIGKGKEGCETGGSFVRIDNELYFICGNSFNIRSDYRVYKMFDFNKYDSLRFDFPDGGFRGWGTVTPVTMGSRTRCYLLTFDRFTPKNSNWNYGNLYCFEGYTNK